MTIPSKLGKYDVVREIARGSMGVVFEAYDPFIDRPVAIKVALADSLRDRDSGERYRRMFFNEAHTAGKLRHPNILDIYDAGVDQEVCYIVMELVRGGDTLKSYTRADRLLPVSRVVEIVFKCAKALDYAHRQGVIHRDIKPSNILLNSDYDVKLADFSIAHITHMDTTRTMPMGFVGSPRYMSPEQVQEDLITHQTDLFSLGIVTYELLTGRHPFAAETFSRLIFKLVNEEPTPLRQHRPELPETLERVVMHALAKDPLGRYRNGLEMASDLSLAFSHLDRPQEEVMGRDRFEDVATLDFFRGFPDAEIWEIMRACIWLDVEPGDRILTEGEFDDSFYIIVAGTVAVTKGERTVDELSAGQCFGEMAYLERIRRTASICARTSVTLLKLNPSVLEQASKDSQLRFCKAFLRTLVERLAHTTEIYARQ